MTPEQISDLIQAAESVHGYYKVSPDVGAGSVSAALLTSQGNIYTGICIDTACSMGFCAEHAAIAEMLKNRETHILGALALSNPKQVIPPCGRCRELMKQINPENMATELAVAIDKFIPLHELLPYPS